MTKNNFFYFLFLIVIIVGFSLSIQYLSSEKGNLSGKLVSNPFSPSCNCQKVLKFNLDKEYTDSLGNKFYLSSSEGSNLKIGVNSETIEKITSGQSYTFSKGNVKSLGILNTDLTGEKPSAIVCLNYPPSNLPISSASASPPTSKFKAPKIVSQKVDKDLSQYPQLFLAGKTFSGFLVVGSNANAINTLALVDISSGLGNEVIVPPAASKLDTELLKKPLTQMILTGNPCDNKIIDYLMGYPRPCDGFLKEGEGMIKLIKNNGVFQLLVMGHSADEVRVAAKILGKYKQYNLKGTEIITAGTINQPQIKSKK